AHQQDRRGSHAASAAVNERTLARSERAEARHEQIRECGEEDLGEGAAILGLECAGDVVELGPEARGFRPGGCGYMPWRCRRSARLTAVARMRMRMSAGPSTGAAASPRVSTDSSPGSRTMM